VVEIEIEDPGVVIDVDTPADLEEARTFLEEGENASVTDNE